MKHSVAKVYSDFWKIRFQNRHKKGLKNNNEKNMWLIKKKGNLPNLFKSRFD